MSSAGRVLMWTRKTCKVNILFENYRTYGTCGTVPYLWYIWYRTIPNELLVLLLPGMVGYLGVIRYCSVGYEILLKNQHRYLMVFVFMVRYRTL
jgi:hypothetical protein